MTGQHQFLEGVVGAGLLVASVQADGAALAAQFFPGTHLAGEHRRQLRGVQRGQRVVRMQDDRQSVDGDHLLGIWAAQVAEAGQGANFAVLDGTRGRGEFGVAFEEGGEAGARTVGG